MKSTHICLKDWNATIEGLGQGIQTILIRNYKTNVNKFLLYPTFTYALKDDYLDIFQGKYNEFIQSNSIPNKKGKKVLIKYFASLEKIIEKPVTKIPSDKNYMWTREHVKNYMTGKTAFIWVLRVYALKEPYWAGPSRAIRYVKLKREVSVDGMKPILSDSQFTKILDEI